jgi:DNA-binding NtrC family response regulator
MARARFDRDPTDPTERHAGLGDAGPAARSRHAAQRSRLAVVVYHAEGTETAPLEVGAPVIVGRKPPATLCVPSVRLSRAHARFTLEPGGRIRVEDLGSTNGTWLRGERIEAAQIGVGDEVVVGDAMTCVQLVAPSERPDLAAPAAGERGPDAPIAASAAMREVLETAARVAGSNAAVILRGETGTGKEVLARLLHDRGPRAGQPLVCVNCAAIPEQLLEATFFGHERGAFTGAAQRQAGVFEEAHGGTVFLDEIGELPLASQAALLRVLETGRFTRVGSPREIAVDVRVIAATHRDLEALRDAGAFRADLYYRLGVIEIAIPPLRDRREDVEPLVRRFMARQGGRVRDLTPAALAVLQGYAWPGNIRELRNTIERAVVLARGVAIDVGDLPARLREPGVAPAPAPSSRPARGAAEEPGGDRAGDLRGQLQEYEARMLLDTLQAVGWNQSEAARRLGMPIRTLSNKVRALGLKRPPPL